MGLPRFELGSRAILLISVESQSPNASPLHHNPIWSFLKSFKPAILLIQDFINPLFSNFSIRQINLLLARN